ncbi:deubiquitinase OTUD6B-like [Dendronephthya gigantea]|uniref:deubiquitinase OTUD6B-like n=1 Tax=Dendronephthya gigantea TaxID=151771 RepID=UPI00106C260A|nr:deubiquitinase OTUD6B-like [Dendronephthya gigantea]
MADNVQSQLQTAGKDPEDDLEDLSQRHKRERKELQAKIQALKRSVPKGDKKKKKEIVAEIALLEAKLDEKHDKEKKESVQNYNEVENDDSSEIVSQLNILEIQPPEQKKPTRAQKRRDKKSAQEKERQKRIEEAEAESVNSARNVEQEKLKSMLTALELTIKEIAPDGHCLYNAIADQLQRLNIQHTYSSLRELAAKYMRDHQDDFLPFLIDQQTGDCYSPEAFSQYCQELRDTAVWGGQLEIQAISSALLVPVKIFQAVGPTIEIGQQYDNQEIMLSFHHHAYGLGKHYNSVISIYEKG